MQKVEISSLPQEIIKLIDAAKAVQKNAYAPYSNYFVGAAILDERGEIHVGCNVENAAWLAIHAEAGAIGAMVSAGGKEIKAIACITKDGGSCCGDCRQKTWQMVNGNTELPIYLVDEVGAVNMTTIGELLPFAFDL